MERRVLAVLTVVLLDGVVASLCILAMAAFEAAPSLVVKDFPAFAVNLSAARSVRVPGLIVVVAAIVAHVGLCGVWWARSAWPSYLRTILAIAGCAALWGLLLLVLAESRRDAVRAAGWAASLGTQAVVTALLAAAIELAAKRRYFANQMVQCEDPSLALRTCVVPVRFSVAFLLLWTTAVAVLLGGGRWLAGRMGWTAESFFAWEYFAQLQALGVANGVLAASLLACVRLAAAWPWRGAALVVTVGAVTACTVAAMYGLFSGKVGASLAELAWLMVVQGMFFVVALVAGELAGQKQQISSRPPLRGGAR